jgi:hypothetical protein
MRWHESACPCKLFVLCCLTMRRVGRVVDGTGLENRHTRKGIGGSNPSLSATTLVILYLRFRSCPVHLSFLILTSNSLFRIPNRIRFPFSQGQAACTFSSLRLQKRAGSLSARRGGPFAPTHPTPSVRDRTFVRTISVHC